MTGAKRVLIAGAGIGGLTAALALLRRGYDVEVFEQAPELKEVGAGVQIAANGSRVLLSLGLEDALAKVAVKAAGKEVRLWNSGETWPLFDLGDESVERYGAPYLLLHRADLHEALIEATRSISPNAIRLGTRCVGFRQDAEGVYLQLEDGEEVRGEVLIGADGLHSAVRRQLFGTDQASFTGGVAWRGVVPVTRLPARLARPVGTNWIGPHGHVITYPLRRGELLNFVGHVERSDWQVESWTEVGTREECKADFEGWNRDVHDIIDNIDQPFKWALFLRRPLEKWSVGRVTLLGDACHATLPYLAQGANMAIEDGFVLARCLDLDRDDAEAALVRYEAARRQRTTEIVNRSADMLGRFHNNDLASSEAARRYVEREWQPDKIRQRYEWLFNYDATNVPI